MLWMDEGISKISIFFKITDVEIQSCLFDQRCTHIYGYKKKKKIVQKKIRRPSGGQLYIK